jgi:uncharacterized membrane protein
MRAETSFKLLNLFNFTWLQYTAGQEWSVVNRVSMANTMKE